METVQADFNRIAHLPHTAWNHNIHYHPFLLRQLPTPLKTALDVGCGSGRFTRLLAQRAEHVVGLDLAPRMIDVAKESSGDYPNIVYESADVMKWGSAEGPFDCVASIATLHHLPLEQALEKLRSLVAVGGTLIVLDLFERATLSDLLLEAVAVPVGLALRLAKVGRLRAPEAVRQAWAAHGQHDTYPTLADVQRVCARLLPGARVRRHLLWRYSIVWRRAA